MHTHVPCGVLADDACAEVGPIPLFGCVKDTEAGGLGACRDGSVYGAHVGASWGAARVVDMLQTTRPGALGAGLAGLSGHRNPPRRASVASEGSSDFCMTRVASMSSDIAA